MEANRTSSSVEKWQRERRRKKSLRERFLFGSGFCQDLASSFCSRCCYVIHTIVMQVESFFLKVTGLFCCCSFEQLLFPWNRLFFQAGKKKQKQKHLQLLQVTQRPPRTTTARGELVVVSVSLFLFICRSFSLLPFCVSVVALQQLIYWCCCWFQWQSSFGVLPFRLYIGSSIELACCCFVFVEPEQRESATPPTRSLC